MLGSTRGTNVMFNTPQTIRSTSWSVHPMERSVSFGGVRGWLWSAALPPTAEDGNSAVQQQVCCFADCWVLRWRARGSVIKTPVQNPLIPTVGSFRRQRPSVGISGFCMEFDVVPEYSTNSYGDSWKNAPCDLSKANYPTVGISGFSYENPWKLTSCGFFRVDWSVCWERYHYLNS